MKIMKIFQTIFKVVDNFHEILEIFCVCIHFTFDECSFDFVVIQNVWRSYTRRPKTLAVIGLAISSLSSAVQ